MSQLPIELHPERQALLDEIALLREELAHLLTEEHELLDIVKPNLLALYQQKIGAWELRRLRTQVEALRARRKLELAQAAVNQGRAPDWDAIDGQLELDLLTWQQRLKEAAEKLSAAEEHFKHLLAPEQDRELKKLYYALVKKLHPDINPQPTENQRRLWHRVRAAYERGDVAELGALSALAEKDAPGNSMPDAVDALRRDRDALKTQIAAMLRRIEQIEAQPPFTLCKQLADESWLAARRDELDAEIAKLDAQHAALQDALKPFLKLTSTGDGQKFGLS